MKINPSIIFKLYYCVCQLILLGLLLMGCHQSNDESTNISNAIEEESPSSLPGDTSETVDEKIDIDSMDIDQLIEVLGNQDKQLRMKAFHKLNGIGFPAVISLIQALSDPDIEIRRLSAFCLGQIGDGSAVHPLLKALQDKSHLVRFWAARSLAMLQVSDAIPLLIEFLNNEDVYLRGLAASSLAWLHDKRSVQPLIIALKDQYRDVRICAAGSLGVLADSDAIEPLMETLENAKDSMEQTIVIRALGRLEDPRVLDLLITLLYDQHDSTRRTSARSLASYGDSIASDRLLKLLNIDNKETRNAAAWALGFRGDARAEKVLDIVWKENTSKWTKVGIACGLVQIRYDRKALDFLLRVINDEPNKVWIDVVFALGRIGNSKAVKPLIHILSLEKYTFYHRQAIEALKRITHLDLGNKTSAWIHWYETEGRPSQKEKSK
jgi:HEAT repeat protein